ncbi:anti-sigma factor antagonist [Saccharothrix syringae]|uniref:anti-sigma factor antagonist n=1 Tax=Saccharothrix syringae TaxID=103733 RepID=UPI000AF2689D|nr:anti-sigma factor antagonist [Saccharothrix syringae]
MHASTQPPNPQQFTAAVSRRPDAVVVSVTGEIDEVTAPELRRVLDEVLLDRPAVVAVDLRGVALLASAGLAALIAAHDQAVPDTRLRIVATDTTPAMRSVQLTGLGDLLVVHPTVDQALAAS